MAISKITRNYQVTLPREIRESVDLKIGDILFLAAEGDEIKISKKPSNAVEKSFGIWGMKEDSVDFVRAIRKDSEKRRKRFGL